MARRYGPDGARQWNGKAPEDFNAEDVRSFLTDTDSIIYGEDDYSMSKNNVAAQEAPADVETQAGQDMDQYLLMEAPIAEMAEAFNMSIDDAVTVRVSAAVEAAMQIEVNVRPIEPRGKLIGVAEVKMNGLSVDDFKVFNGDKGLFLGPPSKPDSSTRSGFRRTAHVYDEDLQAVLDSKALEGYNAAVDKLVARAAAAQAMSVKPSIREAIKEGAEQAAQDNAARPAPEKAGKAGHDDR